MLREGQPVDAIPVDHLEDCVRALDPATRALLDLSLRRGIPDDRTLQQYETLARSLAR